MGVLISSAYLRTNLHLQGYRKEKSMDGLTNTGRAEEKVYQKIHLRQHLGMPVISAVVLGRY